MAREREGLDAVRGREDVQSKRQEHARENP
jgi:hypothetical protein